MNIGNLVSLFTVIVIALSANARAEVQAATPKDQADRSYIPLKELQKRSKENACIDDCHNERVKQEALEPKRTPTTLSLSGGIVTGASTSSFYSATSGPTLAAATEDGNTAWYTSLELSHSYTQTEGPFSFGIIGQLNQYGFQDGSKSDRHFSLFFLPKFETDIKEFSIWLGPLAGVTFTTIGTVSITSGGASVVAGTEKATSFSYGAKAGWNYWMNKQFYFGFEAEYIGFSYTIDGSVVTSSSAVGGKAEFHRSWWQFGGRIGLGI